MKGREYQKPRLFEYGLARVLSSVLLKTKFHAKTLRNELKGVKTPYVIICNHECALDVVYLFNVNKNRHTFVISGSFYKTIKAGNVLKNLKMISKQQFQTKVTDLMAMKKVVDSGHQLVIYPAGLMPENGVSTPIMPSTYEFLKWLGVDVYVARVYGSYFVNPKWSKVKRSGKTLLDVYKLFSKEELKETPVSDVRKKVEDALLYDAYKENEKLNIEYKNGDNVEGLENVLYACPKCKKEFSIKVKDKNTLYCTECGFEETADKRGFLHSKDGDETYKYVSTWDYEIYENLEETVNNTENYSLSKETEILKINEETKSFETVGSGTLTIDKEGLKLNGNISGKELDVKTAINEIPELPSSPGNYIELQHGDDIYRCKLKEGKYIVKYLHLLKIFYKKSTGENVKYVL